MDPIQMMMWQMMQGGMGGGQQPQGAPPQPAQGAAPEMPQRLPSAGQPAAGSFRSAQEAGITPMMADGTPGVAPQQAPGWMDQLGQFLDGMDPNMRLMMGLGGMQNLGRILGGGA